MRTFFAAVALVALIAGCTATGVASTAPSASPSTGQTTPSASPTLTPSPTPDLSIDPDDIAHIVGAIDEASTLTGDNVAEWFNTEGAWVAAAQTAALVNNESIQAYIQLVIEGLQKTIDGETDYTDVVAKIVALRDAIAAIAPDAVPTSIPTPEAPKRFAPGDTITVTEGGEDWATVVVDRVKQVRRYDGPYNIDDMPAKGNIYIQLRVTYVALQNGVDYNPFDWQVFVGGEAADDYTFVSNGPKPELHSGTLPKGRKASGYLVYEVGARGQVLFSYKSNAFSDDPPVFEVLLREVARGVGITTAPSTSFCPSCSARRTAGRF